jgi:ABC-type bacteriocin/lantibiotic exporter with double-glycine peptidase domain
MNYYISSVNLYKRFLLFLKPYIKTGILIGFLMLLSSLLQLPVPLLTRYLIDNIIPVKDLHLLNYLSILLIVIILLNNVISYYHQVLIVNYRVKVEKDIRNALMKNAFLGSLSFFEQEHTGYLQSRLDSDVDAVGHLFLETILEIVMDCLTFVVGVCLLFYLNVKLAIVTILSLPFFVFSFHFFSQKMNKLTLTRQEKWARFRGFLVEVISEIKQIKIFSKQNELLDKGNIYLEDALKSDKKLEIYNAIASIVIGLTGTILPLFVLWYGVRQIIFGTFTLGGFIAFNSCISYLYGPVRNIVNINLDIHSSLAAAQRIFEIIDIQPETKRFGIQTVKTINEVSFSNVTFCFPNREKHCGINNISFTLKKGAVLTVIGETGSGKSTIARLLLGFDVPEQGEIKINNTPYNKFDLLTIRNKITLVPQEPNLFSGSLLDNIVFFHKDYDKKFINYLLDVCVLKDFVSKLPMGLDTNLQEAGVGLSGGEKQRIAIARALYVKPDILILDEATSAIDIVTEKKLLEHLFNLPWNPGILFITHKKTFVNKADKILDLNVK